MDATLSRECPLACCLVRRDWRRSDFFRRCRLHLSALWRGRLRLVTTASELPKYPPRFLHVRWLPSSGSGLLLGMMPSPALLYSAANWSFGLPVHRHGLLVT